MPKLTAALSRSRKRGPVQHRVLPRRRRTQHASSQPPAGAHGVGLLAPSTAGQLPSLTGIAPRYTHITGASLLYDLCRGLVKYDVAPPSLWEATQKNPLLFAKTALDQWMDANGGETIRKHMDLSLEIQDTGASNPRLVAMIECGGCAYLSVGAALDRMEKEAPGLGGAFYLALMAAMWRLLRTWDITDAEYQAEAYNEWAQEEAASAENEQERQQILDQYETYDVKAAIPAYIAKDRDKRECLALLESHTTGKNGSLIKQLLHVRDLSLLQPGKTIATTSEDHEDETPLPAVLVVFKPHDVIEALFDHEAQGMHEYTHAPMQMFAIDPAQPSQVKQLIRTLQNFLEFGKQLCELIEALNDTQERQTKSQ